MTKKRPRPGMRKVCSMKIEPVRMLGISGIMTVTNGIRALRATCQSSTRCSRKSLRPRRADVVGAQTLQQADPGVAGDERRRQQRVGDHRQDEVLGAAPAAGREPLETDAEEEDQPDRDDEVGQRSCPASRQT